MPGLIVRAVGRSETGSATGFYQVVRSIGLTVGSALSASVLMAHTRPGRTFPEVSGFEVALIVCAGICLATAVVSLALPGRSNRGVRHEGQAHDVIDEMMVEDAELGGSGFALTVERDSVETVATAPGDELC